MLFSERSVWTMVHGIGLGGGALVCLAAALFHLYAVCSSEGEAAPPGSGPLAGATSLSAVLLWLTVIVGTYIIFPSMGAACVASAGANPFTSTAVSLTVFPIVPDFERYPTNGRDLRQTSGEIGLAGIGSRFCCITCFCTRHGSSPAGV